MAFARRAFRTSVAAAVAALLLVPSAAVAQDQQVLGNLAWMTAFPSTWNAGSPKVVSDGLHYYAVICGFGGSPSYCSIARKRGVGPWQSDGNRLFMSNQPAVMVIDRKGRLNVFFNDPNIQHFRFDHPAIDLTDCMQINVPFNGPVGYLHASYDAVDDILMLTFNETSNWGMKLATKQTDLNGWVVNSMPAANSGTLHLYARTLHTQNRFAMLVGEHPIGANNAHYTAAILFESAAASGPWTTRVLHRVTGNNLGVPYENWVYPNDVQADAGGRIRAMVHITEPQSGHANNLNGLYILREEDGYAARLIGPGIEDGFTLYVDPSGTHVAFARAQVPSGPTAPQVFTGDVVSFRSTDGGANWGSQVVESQTALNPVVVEQRNGSMLGGDTVSILYSNENTDTHSFDGVWYRTVTAALPQGANRYDFQYVDADGSTDYVRAFRDPASNRQFYYVYDHAPNGSFALTYTYRAGQFCQSYVLNSSGAFRLYNNDGYDMSSGTPTIAKYLVDDGTRTLHLSGVCPMPAKVTNIRIVPGN